MKMKFGIKEVVAAGIGTALFIVLTQVQIPIGIPNTYLQPRMAILAFMSAVFGPVVGAIIGLVGHGTPRVRKKEKTYLVFGKTAPETGHSCNCLCSGVPCRLTGHYLEEREQILQPVQEAVIRMKEENL